MQLQTQIPLKSEKKQIDYNSKLVLLGSCFSENIGNKFKYYKFQSTQNPFGILFQPKAIENLVSNAITKKEYNENDVFLHNEQWHCFDAHSVKSNSKKGIVLADLDNAIKKTEGELINASHVIITLGTSWVYRFLKNNHIVANCHKIPQKEFSKELLSTEEIYKSLASIHQLIKKVNNKVSIVFTVSPVRHIKDGFIENQRSKAHLISGIHHYIDNSENTYYFPSYEIMMDELRDYRFYKEDMLHPNSTAINYIWEKFKQVWITKEAQKTMEEVNTIQKGLAHKPFNPSSEQHEKFLKKLAQKKETLQKVFPFIKF